MCSKEWIEVLKWKVSVKSQVKLFLSSNVSSSCSCPLESDAHVALAPSSAELGPPRPVTCTATSCRHVSYDRLQLRLQSVSAGLRKSIVAALNRTSLIRCHFAPFFFINIIDSVKISIRIIVKSTHHHADPTRPSFELQGTSSFILDHRSSLTGSRTCFSALRP